ncbi:MAG: hypothetical protein ACE5OZ_25615 [Candidatus Heimdallarchaeota archaeon]
MRFEMYVRHIFQEHAEDYPAMEIPVADWTGRWTKSPTYGKYCPCKGAVAMIPHDEELITLQRIFLRSEEFGGLLYDPTTTIIYKLDQEAFTLVQKLQSFMKEKKVDKNDPQLLKLLAEIFDMKLSVISELIHKLKEVNLW